MEIITLRLAGRLAAQSYRQDGCRCWVLTARWRGDRRAHVSYRVLADGSEAVIEWSADQFHVAHAHLSPRFNSATRVYTSIAYIYGQEA